MRRGLAAPQTLAAAVIVALSLLAACVPTPAARSSDGPSGAATRTAVPATPAPTAVPSGPTPPPSFVRPTPTPLPTFASYVVKPGDTLLSIARAHGTTARSLAFWNRTRYPSLDPDAPTYDPNRIEIGWVLLLVPDTEIDEDSTFPE
ncbi:MAG TPA: LysM peptidoglycan-binding domain-containing protein [Methylomirabilota bacterium]|nr:LysM peptidoglycan-binding domain-containing protein [Methylomirabilota bacterium]